MQSIMRLLAAALLVTTLAGCKTPATNPSKGELDPADAAKITQLIRASHPRCTISHFTPLRDVSIVYIATTCEVYKAVKARGHWRLVPAHIIITN
jgi:hypothetical protein